MKAGMDSRFESVLGSSGVLADPIVLERYAIEGITPPLVLKPSTTEQISAILRICNEQQWRVVPFGSGAHQDAGRLPDGVDVVLSTEELNRIQAYDPGDLTISVEAGLKVADAAAACAQHQQLLPIEAERATIGGALAAAQSGPLRVGFGGIRDFCIGISFVTGDGVSGRGGGRVVKNVAGYDLMKLLIGSYGTLSIITGANFKVFPAPRQTVTFVCEFGSLEDAMGLRDVLLTSPLSPIACELMSPAAMEYLHELEARDPDDWAPDTPNCSSPSWKLALRFAGSDLLLARIRRELSSFAASELMGAEEIEVWQQIRAFEQRLVRRHRNAMIFHVEVPIAESKRALEAAQRASTDYNFVSAMIGRASIGSFVIGFLPLAVDPPGVMQYAAAASHFRSRLSKSASAIVVRCPREAKQHFDVWGSTPTDLELMQKVKRALDPGGILNRGRFLVG